MKKIITCLLATLGLTSVCGQAKEQREVLDVGLKNNYMVQQIEITLKPKSRGVHLVTSEVVTIIGE